MTEPTADHTQEQPDLASAEDEKWPVGFILTIVMVGGYLAYRLVEGAVLFYQWIF